MIDEIRKRLIDSDLSPTDLKTVLRILDEVQKGEVQDDKGNNPGLYPDG